MNTSTAALKLVPPEPGIVDYPPDSSGPHSADSAHQPVSSRPQAADLAIPASQQEIDELRLRIDDIDSELIRLIAERTATSRAIGAARRRMGGPRIVYSRELLILERFRELGPAGHDLALLLLVMGRGRLGWKL